jgi:Cache domain
VKFPAAFVHVNYFNMGANLYLCVSAEHDLPQHAASLILTDNHASMLLVQVLPAFLGMVGFVVLTIVPFQQRVPDWSDDLVASMQGAELANLQTRVGILRTKAHEVFALSTTDAAILAFYATSLFSEPSQLPVKNSYPLFSGQPAIAPTYPPGFGADDKWNASSSWFLKGATKKPALLATSSALDDVYRSIYLSNTKLYDAVFVGFEADGLLQIYPGTHMEAYRTLQYTCVATNQTLTGYDARCRGWYYAAASEDISGASSSTFFSAPYVIPAGSTLITVSRAVVVDNALYGVVGLDISMSDLQSAIVSTTFLENGYSYMINTAGEVIVHPDVEPGTPKSIEAAEFTDTSEATAFTQLLQTEVFNTNDTRNSTDATATSTCGLLTYVKHGAEWQLAHCTVPGTSYTVVITVPTADTTAAIDSIKSANTKSLNIGTAIMSVLSVLCLALGLWVNVRVGRRIVRPVQELIRVLDAITQQNFDQAVGDMAPASAEISIMYR